MLKEKVKVLNLKTKEMLDKVDKGDVSAQDLIGFLQSSSEVLIRLYPQAWQEKLEQLNIKEKWLKIKEIGQVLNDFVDNYEIISEEGIIKITLDDGTLLIEPLRDLNIVLQIEWSIPKDHEDYFLLLGFLSQENNYSLAQLYLSGKNLIV